MKSCIKGIRAASVTQGKEPTDYQPPGPIPPYPIRVTTEEGVKLVYLVPGV